MIKREITYPIIISKTVTTTDYPFIVEIPDIQGMTQAKTEMDARRMAEDYIKNYFSDTVTTDDVPPTKYKNLEMLRHNETDIVENLTVIFY